MFWVFFGGEGIFVFISVFEKADIVLCRILFQHFAHFPFTCNITCRTWESQAAGTGSDLRN